MEEEYRRKGDQMERTERRDGEQNRREISNFS